MARRRLAFAAALILARWSSFAAQLPAGRLCVAGVECRPYVCGQTVPVSAERRTFTLRMKDGASVLGVLPAGIGTISCTGYDEVVPVPPARATTAVGAIYLSLGGVISVEMDQVEAGSVEEVELQKPAKGQPTGIALAHRPVPSTAAVAVVTFENLEPGPYIVVAKGRQPWERRGAVVELEPGQPVTVHQRIAPFTLHVRTELEGEPLPAAEVLVTNKDGHWSGALTTDARAEAEVRLWQGGNLNVAVHSTALSAPYIEHRHLMDGEDADWTLVVPNREIVGTVVDAVTGDPIPRAALSLHVASDDGYSVAVQATSDEKGAFRFSPVAYGEHTLKAAAANYPPVESSYLFQAPARSRNVTVRLTRAEVVKLQVIDDNGSPVAGARVMHHRGLARLGISNTDGSGSVELPVIPNESSQAYVVPRDGSFAVTDLSSAAAGSVLRVPAGSARIELRAESETHDPIPEVSLVVRFNGRILPPEVVEALAAFQGARATSGKDGRIVFLRMPAGVYEFWPAGSPAEVRALASGVGPAAPVRMVAAPGENVAVMTFASTTAP